MLRPNDVTRVWRASGQPADAANERRADIMESMTSYQKLMKFGRNSLQLNYIRID